MNDLTRQRWLAFKSRRASYVSLVVLGGLFALSLFSELLANDRPLVLHYEGRWYFPVFSAYLPAEFGQRDTFVVDYRRVLAVMDTNDWAVNPPYPGGRSNRMRLWKATPRHRACGIGWAATTRGAICWPG